MPKLDWIVLALFLTGSEAIALAAAGFGQPSAAAVSTPAQADVLHSFQLPQRRPKKRLGGRDGGVCTVSPGLLEAENVVWSDRPLFLWQPMTEGIVLQQIMVFDQDGRILWEQPLAATDQSAIYAGQALQPGQFYQWRLEWTVEETENSADYTFQIMAPARRDQIAAELQALTRQLQASGASAEEIARQQSNYFIDLEKPLWSDALKLLYSVENPSITTTQTIQTWMNDVCGEQENA